MNCALKLVNEIILGNSRVLFKCFLINIKATEILTVQFDSSHLYV